MVAEIINESGEPDVEGEHKTYDLLIEHDGTCYWKFGMTCKRIARRFAREPNTTRITIRQLWRHKTEAKASSHENGLFRRHKGDRPFIGKMGPLLGGGNTEVYSHDVVNGEAAPHTFKVVRINPEGWRDTFLCYSDFDPYSRWETQYHWVAGLSGPDFDAYLLTAKSDDRKITVCSTEYLEAVASGRGFTGMSRLAAEQALDEANWVFNYAHSYREITTRPSSLWLPRPYR